MSSSLLFTASLAISGALARGQILPPTQDINLPSSEIVTAPLEWTGANGPWFAGPDVYGISSDVPENCYVDRAAYMTRHGSRYPDAGAYAGWVAMQKRFSARGYTAKGSLSFLPRWRTALTNESLQIAMLNPTGSKEAHDLGYQLRYRYPDLYQEGEDFAVWANNYTRVLQTAKAFVQGYLGFNAAAAGSVISVTSKGFPGAIGNSLSPSDQCPNFADSSGGDYKTTWDAQYQPPIAARLQSLIEGNLTILDSDVDQMPYLCGFESHILGRLSPWCGVLTDSELKEYEYSQDLRYYYGLGPGTDLEQKMMTPYLDAVLELLARDSSDITGTAADGSSFKLPKLLMSFINDGQIAELITASGVFDNQSPLSATTKDDNRLFIASHFVSMRGTIAFERLNCRVSPDNGSGDSSSYSSMLASSSSVATPTRRPCGSRPKSTSSGSPTPPPLTTAYPRLRRSANHTTGTNETYVRIRLNDAVYPLPSCRNGPGSSCLLEDYVKYIKNKYAAQGDWLANCNVTTPGAPTKVQGASFYTDLTSPWLQAIPPY
ncbi:histidine acid phosphatase [Xylariaceae sp. FL1651]|nr:histidine acid phosphatase [Xylariaceae sp. FL1651]